MTDRMKMLRQGRGDGFRAALAARAVEDVLACVVDDPRWDRQVESREEYYASLLVALEADVAVISARLLDADERHERDVWLAIGVLVEMVRRGHAGAASALDEAIRGRWWRLCLDALAAKGQELLAQVVTPALIAELTLHVGSNALAGAVTDVAGSPWQPRVAEVPALRFAVDAAATREAKPMTGPIGWIAPKLRLKVPKPDPTLSNAELHALAMRNPGQRVAVLRLLGERGCDEFVGDAEVLLRSQSLDDRRGDVDANRWRVGYVRYLEALPAAVTLQRARAWFAEPWPLRLAAGSILARHATPDDRVMLETAGRVALTEGDMYRLCDCIDALATAGSRDSLPLLLTIYGEVPYSYARRRAIDALIRHSDDDGARARLVEALWDCEADSRQHACEALGANDAPQRLTDLAADTLEDDDVRVAARAALSRR